MPRSADYETGRSPSVPETTTDYRGDSGDTSEPYPNSILEAHIECRSCLLCGIAAKLMVLDESPTGDLL
ncbi:MAG: hypothetical protein MUO99_04335 [Dehalococcoidales bacterium]|nr:hypothetical protein [Dehalococcoidales bacterium]